MTENSQLPEEQLQALKDALDDHYVIEEEVGAGGMGIVFRAQDLKLGRTVALKVLRPEIALSVGTERFLREVRIAAGLTHPHILPVHDSGEGGGLLYFVTPFIEGESLADKLKREKQLPCDEALKICREVADALMFAHRQGVIHRDVKPGNILMESGHALLADFGLAKAISAGDDQGLTRTGFSVGTPAYSSPEQAVAEEGLDGRADLYSLGCVLYEMLAGQPPFIGPTSDTVVRLHITAEPMSVKIMRPALPGAVESIIDQLLAKAPADRFPSAEALIQAIDAAVSGESPIRGRGAERPKPNLRRTVLWATTAFAMVVAGWWAFDTFWPPSGQGSPTPTDGLYNPSDLAVLYFEDLSSDGALQHVADGLTEGLISELSRVPELTVVSGNGVAPFRGSLAPLDSIAEALEVGTLIRGEIEPVGDRLRISVHLVEGNSGSVFDRKTFEVPGSELLAARDSVLGEAAWLLRERMGEEVRLRRRQAETTSVEAWALVQRGERERKQAEDLLLLSDVEGAFGAFARADSLLVLAEGADPQWVEPVRMRGWVAYWESREAMDLAGAVSGIDGAVAHAERVLAMDPNDAKALELRGTARYWRWILEITPDLDEQAALLAHAQDDLEMAASMDPSLAGAYATLSHLYYQTSDPTIALVTARRAYEADLYLASAESVLWRLFSAAYDAERFTQARWACAEGHKRFPQAPRFWRCRILDMTLPGGTPDADEAWRLHERVLEVAPEARREIEGCIAKINVAEVLVMENLPDSARAVLLASRADYDVDPYQELPYLEAHVRTVLGDYDEAIDLLSLLFAGFSEAGGDEADWATHWFWKDLRGQERFERLVRGS